MKKVGRPALPAEEVKARQKAREAKAEAKEKKILLKEQKKKPVKEPRFYSMTGNFGYMRAFIPLALSVSGFFRLRYVS